jgi:NitT/TauT family transport system substrate-binding protein
MQPPHTGYTRADGTDEWSRRLGTTRADHAWRLRDLRDAGATVALGSDWPIAHFDARAVLAMAQAPHGAASARAGLTGLQALEGCTTHAALAAGEADISMNYIGPVIVRMAAGDPLVVLAGIHIGCFELFGSERVQAIRDLKDKTIAVPWRGPGPETFIATMLAYVGLDPGKDINFVVHTTGESIQLLAEGGIDAYLGLPPIPQELRATQIGHVVVNSTVDRPWSQYFCCLVAGNQDFVRKHPAATKRAVRAILKADQICAREPERAARTMVDRGFTKSYAYALQTMTDVPYGRWREYDPEDTVRFYALRLHEVGMLKSTPQKILAQHTDWRFLNELKQELKG